LPGIVLGKPFKRLLASGFGKTAGRFLVVSKRPGAPARSRNASAIPAQQSFLGYFSIRPVKPYPRSSFAFAMAPEISPALRVDNIKRDATCGRSEDYGRDLRSRRR
jgi:hypothetical protein